MQMRQTAAAAAYAKNNFDDYFEDENVADD